MPDNEWPDEIVEAVARIIEPRSWDAYDLSLAPYKENRGSTGEENFWYQQTFRQGCRTIEDIKKFWIDPPMSVIPERMIFWAESFNYARAALSAIAPYIAAREAAALERAALECDKEREGWKQNNCPQAAFGARRCAIAIRALKPVKNNSQSK